MEPLLLAQQSTAVFSRTGEIFEDAPEGETPRQILRNAFYGITDALLNITEVDGIPALDTSEQSNRLERLKSQAGLFTLTTLDWLRQVKANLRCANKAQLVGGALTGISGAMGVPMLHLTDVYENPMHTLVADMPEQKIGPAECIDPWVINQDDNRSVQAAISLACVDAQGNPLIISDALAQEFRNQAAGWPATIYEHDMVPEGMDSGDFLATWLRDNSNRVDAPPESAIVETPVNLAATCDVNNFIPGTSYTLDFTSQETLLKDLRNQCGLNLTNEQFNNFVFYSGGNLGQGEVTFTMQDFARFVRSLGIEVVGTPVAFEGVPPTPVVTLPGAEGAQVLPGGETQEEGEGFWETNLIERYKDWMDKLNRSSRITINMLNLSVGSLGLFITTSLIMYFRHLKKK